MVDYRYHSARVRCKSIDGRVHAKYSGPMSLGTCLHLGEKVVLHAGSRPTIECLCKALTMVQSGESPDVSYLVGSQPGCYVVRPDQYDLMLEFTGILSALGVRRMVFLDPAVAQRWIGLSC